MKTQIIELELKQIEPDYGEWKPLRPVLVPWEHIIIEMAVDFDDADCMVKAGEVRITTSGFEKLMRTVQDTIGESTYKLNLDWNDVTARLQKEWAK